MTVLVIVLIGLLAWCFIGVATLAAAEVSIIRVRRSEVLLDARLGVARSEQLLRLIDNLPVVLNTVLLLVLLLQVTSATVAGYLADRWFGGIGVTIATMVITVVLFIYAEAIPKTRAVSAPKQTALRLTPLLRLLVGLLRPVVASLVWLADLQAPGRTASFGALTEDEIRALARESAEAGAIGEGDADLVARSFEFNDRRVAEVMVERRRIATVHVDDAAADALSQAIVVGHRRLPVQRADLDDIVGVVRLRDVAAASRFSPDATAGSVMSAVLRCRAEDPISHLLNRMQRSGRWIAIVTDDDGRTVGLATVEDLVAELVGEIDDDRSAIDARGDRMGDD